MIELYNRLVLTQSQNEPISVFSLDEVREVRDYNPDLIRRSIAGSESTALGTHLSAIHPVWGVMKGESCAFAFLHDPELKGLGGWAVTSDGSVLVDYWDGPASAYQPDRKDYREFPHILMKFASDGSVSAVCVDRFKAGERYILGDRLDKKRRSTAALLYGLTIASVYRTDPSWSNEQQSAQFKLADAFSSALLHEAPDYASLAMLNADVRRLLKKNDPDNARYIDRVNVFSMNRINLDEIPLLDLSEKYEFAEDTIHGDMSRFMGERLQEIEVPGKKKASAASLAGKYDPDPERIYTREEESLIPVIPEDYVIPDKLEYAANLYKASYHSRHPFRNFILRGEPGTGKTIWCRIFAAAIHKPLVTFECSTDTEKLDLTLNIIPDVSGKKHFSMDFHDFAENMPSPEEILLDPEGSYERISGEPKKDASSRDCQEAILKAFAEADEGASGGFEKVYSTLVQAFRNGWVCEIQEPTVLTRPGVLAALNSMFDSCSSVHLVDGEYIQRNKDAVIIMTTNVDCEGCTGLNQSVLSRFTPIDLERISEDELVKRIANVTGYQNFPKLQLMVKTYSKCREYASEKAVSDGAIDVRALEDWAAANLINGDVFGNGRNLFISKTSNDPDLKAEFMSCLEAYFRPGD